MDESHDDRRRIADGESAILSLADVRQPGTIERREEEGSVRYTDVLLIAPGVWTDANSRQRIWYSPEGIQNSADNWADDRLNLLHEQEDETLEIGHVDTASTYVDETGNLYGDLVLHRDNDASRLADDSLKRALETGGAEGIRGPSVELRGEEYRWNSEHEAHELVEGTFTGVGLVGLGLTAGPASKPADFARQTAARAVALADGDGDPPVYTLDNDHEMTIDTETVRQRLADEGVELDDVDDDTLETALADALETEASDPDPDDPPADGTEADLQEDEDDEDEAEEQTDGDDTPEDEDEDDGDDETDMSALVEQLNANFGEVQERLEALDQRLTSLEDETEQLRTSDTSMTEIADQLETLADGAAEAETVSDLESRLEALESEPEEPKSLADGASFDDDYDTDPIVTEMGGSDPTRPRVTFDP